jgi:small subunit ribosomal protein S18
MSLSSTYELYFIINPELNSNQTNEIIKSVESLLTTVVKAGDIVTSQEGLRNLAYPIKKNWSGFYVNITYTLAAENKPTLKMLEQRLNLQESIVRYINVNQSEFLEAKAKQGEIKSEITDHRELNKGRSKKICISKHLGLNVIDYKNTEYLKQFTSPYAKIFNRDKTGSSAKYQRKITKAIKRARHMGLMPFTTKHYS